METINKPCDEEVKKYLQIWNNDEIFVEQERCLKKLFIEDMANNKILENVLIKCCVLNTFYSTNIYSIYPVAKHIQSLDIDTRLKNGDATLVNDIARVNINGKEMNLYSFATKYCSHHNSSEFAIYDSYVEKVLMYFKKQDNFYDFKLEDLKNYEKFKEVIIAFKKFYNIDKYALKEIDKYIWQLGKKHFNKYDKE